MIKMQTNGDRVGVTREWVRIQWMDGLPKISKWVKCTSVRLFVYSNCVC